MPKIRPPRFSGSFYPGLATELRVAVEELLGEARRRAAAPSLPDAPPVPGSPRPAHRLPKALVAPHAGYVYSGPIAGSAFAQIPAAGSRVRKVVLLGPSHRVAFRGMALPGVDALATPLGEVRVAGDLAATALGLPQVAVLAAAHEDEHSLEVELPFLQVLLGEFEVVPLVVGESAGEEVAEVLERLWGGPETVVVVSSDLSHYLPADSAERVDRDTAAEIVGLGGPLHSRQACGALPLNGLLVAARRFGLEPRLLDLRHSGDTAGDRSRVVGYGAFAFYG